MSYQRVNVALLVATGLLLTASTAMLYSAAQIARGTANQAAGAGPAVTVAAPRVTTTPLGTAEYAAIAKDIGVLFPGIQLESKPNGLEVHTAELSHYQTWLAAVGVATGARPGVRWEVATMCVGACPSAKAGYTAELRGVRASVVAGAAEPAAAGPQGPAVPADATPPFPGMSRRSRIPTP